MPERDPIAAGDFRAFYGRWFPKIWRFVSIRIADRDLAEDLVSEIFLKALRAFGSYDEARSRSSWIYTIARNHLANHWRDTSGKETSDADIEDLPLAGADFGEAAARHHDVTLVHEALATMAPDKASLVRMKYLEELSYEEMEERLGKDRNALKVATFRAMQELRRLLKDRL